MTKVFGIHWAVLAILIVLGLAPFSPSISILLLTGLGLSMVFRKRLPGLIGSESGVVAVSYYIEGGGITINGSTTPPTAIQAQQVPMQKALISVADTDTQALFTHNWGLGTSAPTYFNPEIFYYALLQTAGGTFLTGFTFDVTNTNVVKINKLSYVGSGGSFVVTLRRPFSIGQ